MRDWVVGARPDLVHVHDLAPFGLGALDVLAHAGPPVVVTLHDYWPICPRAGLLQPGGGACDKPRPKLCAMCLEDTWLRLEVSPDQMAGRTLIALEQLVRADRLVAPSETARTVYAR